MNAVIALCHFCEIHGPNVLFCTQPVRTQSQLTTDDEESQYMKERRVKSPATVGGANSDNHHTNKTSDICDACRSIPTTLPGYISHDTEAQVSYVSSQNPSHRQVFSMVRQACVRSLSCEVCQGREGPIFFGEDQQGYVLSYTFYISDSQARGLQRWYSIVIVMMDKIYLLNSWPFLVTHIRQVIDELQDKAKKVYDIEQARCPQRALRLSTSTISPANFRHLRGGTVRSLIELTRDKSLFSRLHSSFVWILKACGNRITEKLLEGPPTEDSIIDLEKQEETEEGFVKLFSKKTGLGDLENEDEANKSEQSADDEEESSVPRFKNLRHLWKVLGEHKAHILAHHVIVGNQIIIRGEHRPLIRSIITCLKSLLPRGCCSAVTHSDQYEESWRCNFLGLHENVKLPNHIKTSELFILVDVMNRQGSYPDHPDDFVAYEFVMKSPTALPDKCPTVLSKMERAIRNDCLNYTVVESMMVCLKEEWMNKVKVLFKFTKAGGSRTESETKKLLHIVQARQEDMPVLKFWMTGLSVQYRTHMLSTGMDTPR